jgi:hypothetical protein
LAELRRRWKIGHWDRLHRGLFERKRLDGVSAGALTLIVSRR